MASRPPPRFVVRPHDERRHRGFWLGLAWLGSVVLTGALVAWLTSHDAPASVDHRQQRALNAQIEQLKQQLANLESAARVNEVATRSLRNTLTQRETELSSLRADLGFYSRLVGGEGQHAGLQVQGVRLRPITGSRGWDISLSLSQNTRRGSDISGAVTVSVEGLRGDKVTRLDWAALGDADQKAGIPFKFQYFQQLRGTLVLPADFHPTRLRLHIQPEGQPAIVRSVAWSDALSGNINTVLGDNDAQP
jgi:hypothetical protein